MTIADRIIKKCGGVAETARLSENSENWVYKWRLEKDKGGTGGLVPRSAQEKLIKAASRGEVEITPNDFFEATQ